MSNIVIPCITNNDTEKMVMLYRDNPNLINGKALGHIFQLLAKICIKFAKFPKQGKITERNCAYTCFENIQNFDPKKGKALNYFLTIILNEMRKEYRAWKDAVEQQKKYREFVK
jgi:DNA phosphorothioation-dependent restriction protein DptG